MEYFDPLYLCSNPNCKEVFTSGLKICAEGVTIPDTGSISAPCPRCGAKGFVPSGKFSRNKDILIALVKQLESADIRSLQSEVARYIDVEKTPNAIKRDLKKKYPKYKKIWVNMPEEAKDMILFLGWLLGVLSAIISLASFISEMTDDDIENKIINPSINHYYDNDKQRNESQNKKPQSQAKQYIT